MRRTYIGLGSNIGDRAAYLAAAIDRVAALDGVIVVAQSSLYETDPVGPVAQDAFLNAVLCVETSVPPEAFLSALLDIERSLGRVRDIHWGPRTIDLDILWMDGIVQASATLTLPHPFVFERAFVLVPLLECCHVQDIDLRARAQQALDGHPEEGGVRKWMPKN